ncbi:MAG TPA: hypothetical protein PLR35_16650 [Burkholderiaceae bacterium]|nr:hypothetical protein [Burkholderiaceae bacterium]
MTAKTVRITTALAVAAAFTAGANAEYRCDPAPSPADRAACEAAAQGPDALRRYVESMNAIRVNLQFADYVDLKTAQRWQAEERQLTAQKEANDAAQTVASNATR